jgi:hypothetical protein
LAMILPVILIVAAELLTSILRAAGRWGGVTQTTLSLVLIIACTAQLQSNYVGALSQYPILHNTQFGRLPFAKPGEVEDVEWIKNKLELSSSRDMLCYTAWSAIYLMTGARNPTRHEVIVPGYQSDEEVQDVIDTLERKRVENALLITMPQIKPDDPIRTYVARHYRCTEKSFFQFCARHEME